jgi:hypothetical protein
MAGPLEYSAPMKKQFIFIPLVVILLTSKACSLELPANSEDSNNFFSSPGWTNLVLLVNAKADLGAQLNWNTNEDVASDFDKQVCKSLHIQSRSPVMISYKELSTVFHFSKTNELFDSSQEMGGSFSLIYQDGKITRTNTEDHVPINYIPLLDPKVKELNVDIDLLLSVTPLEKPEDVKYERRSFRFVYRNRWVND